jgi:hypothetical protein
MLAHDFADAEWRKSSRSNGGGACVEIAWRKGSRSNGAGNCVELGWRKSSRSNGGGNCVELALAAEAVAFRDSKNPEGAILTFPSASLATFFSRC